MMALAATMAALLAAPDDRLPGTAPLAPVADRASDMVAGIDRFLLRKIDESAAKRDGFSKRGAASAEEHVSDVEPSRVRLTKILGLRESRLPTIEMQVLSTPTTPRLVAEDDGLEVAAVRWEALRDVWGEGLLLTPKGVIVADVVAIPDATQTPEAICGLKAGVPPESQFALRLARSGCRVLVPALIGRGRTFGDLSDREWLYRPSFELGRHLIGYELEMVLAGESWLAESRRGAEAGRPIGVIGHGDGGMLALYAAAINGRIAASCVSGYFGDRSKIWTEPIDRNVFGLLERFGDAEVAAMIAPRPVIVEASKAPTVVVEAGKKAAPGSIAQQSLDAVRAEAKKAESFVPNLPGRPFVAVVPSGDGEGPQGSSAALSAFLAALSPEAALAEVAPLPAAVGPLPDAAERNHRLRRAIERKNQEILESSHVARDQFFQGVDTSSLDAYAKSIEAYREVFDRDVIGRFDDAMLPANGRSRRIFDEPKFDGYEVELDVFPDVVAFGILLVPKGMKPGERRPVVVCQHGLEGRPTDVADPKVNNPAYNQFAAKLAERGFVTFAPQNPYIFGDRFRTLQRKANPLGKTLFSIIVPQHRQIVAWLKSRDFVDPERIAFYGLSYGGKSAMRIPALVTEYCLSICSADFNEWVWKNASTTSPYSYVWTNEYEIFEFNLGETFNYAEMAALIAPRPFMVERGHSDGVAPDEKVAHEYAKVRRLYAAKLKIPERTKIEFFDGPHTIHGVGTFEFVHKHLNWPKP